MKSMDQKSYSFAIIGGGAVGLSTAIALAQAGHHTVIFTGGVNLPDMGRTAALLQGSLEFLYSLGIEDAINAESWPLAAIRLIDAKGGLIRAPTVMFRAVELGLPDFGRNISNNKLVQVLRQQALATPNLDVMDVKVAKTDISEDEVHFRLEDGSVATASVAIAADGRGSPTRDASGIATREWSYSQTALTFHVSHTRDHEDISTEFHTRTGPFTLVPLQPYLSSVVWMTKPDHTKELLALSSSEFAHAAEQQCQSILGKLTLNGSIGNWPLSSLIAQRFSAPRLALVGEAAHAFPPIGAQGLNLGLRDAAALSALATGSDLSSPETLKRYDSNRRLDVELRTAAVDLFNRSLLSSFLPVDVARSLALGAVSSISPLRKWIMRLGMGEKYASERQ